MMLVVWPMRVVMAMAAAIMTAIVTVAAIVATVVIPAIVTATTIMLTMACVTITPIAVARRRFDQRRCTGQHCDQGKAEQLVHVVPRA